MDRDVTAVHALIDHKLAAELADGRRGVFDSRPFLAQYTEANADARKPDWILEAPHAGWPDVPRARDRLSAAGRFSP